MIGPLERCPAAGECTPCVFKGRKRCYRCGAEPPTSTVQCVGCKRRIRLVDSYSPHDEALCAQCDTEVTGRLHYRKGSVKAALLELLPSDVNEGFDVTFWELWRDSEGGWTVNDGWKAGRGLDKAATVDLLAERWEVFKLNYLSRARARDLVDSGDAYPHDGRVEARIEVDCTSFANVTWPAGKTDRDVADFDNQGKEASAQS
jgi:hypothetical protein